MDDRREVNESKENRIWLRTWKYHRLLWWDDEDDRNQHLEQHGHFVDTEIKTVDVLTHGM